MRILSIRQPWAGLIVAGLKPIENRSRRSTYTGPLLIHASRTVDEQATAGFLWRRYRVRLPPDCELLGGIIGMVEMHGCVQDWPSRWFHGPHGYLLRDARRLPFTPFRGTLALMVPQPDLLARLGLLQAA